MTVFGVTTEAKLFLPVATANWNIAGIVTNGSANIILASFSLDDMEAIDIRRCFNETNHIFALGRDIERSILTVEVIVFLGKVCDGSGSKTIDNIRGAYESHRVSKSRSSFDVQIGTYLQASGFPIRMTVGSVDPATQSCRIAFTFILDDKGKK